ncbi:MAG: hypothetical protein P9X24_18895 [Candidatus Hatepunaea meridiana]|nr:hypothetical protein [Candidatus Hatepunaea meridiana]
MEIINDIQVRLKILRKQIKHQPALFAHLADCYILTGKHHQAEKTLIAGLKQFPDSITGWLVYGNLHLENGQSKRALFAFERALIINNDIAYAHQKCAEILEAEWEFGRSISHLRDLKRLNPLSGYTQKTLELLIIRNIVIENNFFNKKDVLVVSPSNLRLTLLKHDLLPEQFIRVKERDQTKKL